jgi:hypothetical protein
MVILKCKYAELIGQIQPAIADLSGSKLKDVKTILDIARIKKAIDEETSVYWETRKEIAERYSKKDEQGNPEIDDNYYVYTSDEGKTKTNTLLVELWDQDVEIKVENASSIDADKLESVDGIAPGTIANLLQVIA